MDLFTRFVTFCIGHQECTGLLNYVALPNVDIFHYTISKKKSHSLSPPSSSRSLFLRKLSNPEWQVQVLQNSDFLLESQISSLATSTVS